MQITIDLSTFVAMASALTFAGGAAIWALRRVDEAKTVPRLAKDLDGDPEARETAARAGLRRRVDDVESDLTAALRFQRGVAIAFRVPPSSDEHVIAEAILRRLAEIGSTADETGPHRAVPHAHQHPPLAGQPTRRQLPLPREEPPSDPPPPPDRRRRP